MRTDVTQRQTLTVVFSDLSGSTQIAESLELEDYEAFLQDIRDRAQAIVAAYGGEVVRYDGDGLLSIFGYPVPHEDAVQRAIDSSLDLLDSINEFGQEQTYTKLPVNMHIGIHSGVVLLKEGDFQRGRYEVLGDTPNVAARMSNEAEPGEICISVDTLGRDRHQYVTTAPELTSIRARKGSKYVCKILAKKDAYQTAKTREKRANDPFFGRTALLEQLRSVLRGETGTTRLLVQAEAGMGKSRLLSEAESLAAELSYRSARCYCSSYTGTSELSPIRQLLAQLVDTASSTWRTSVTGVNLRRFAAGGSGSEATDFESLAHGIQSLLQDLTESGPDLVLFLDDWHWADDTSKQLMEHVQSFALPKVLFVIAERVKFLDPHSSNTLNQINIAPLTPSEASDYVRYLVPTLDELSVEAIVERSGGNPLFLEELSHATKLNVVAGPNTQSDAWVYALIQSRFDLLDKQEKQYLEAASTIGRVAPSWLLSELSPETTPDLVERLIEKDFLMPSDEPGMISFKHGITAEAVRAHIPAPQTAKICTRIARALDTPERVTSPGELARYYLGARDHKRGVELSVQAGQSALRSNALDRAQFHLHTALSHADRAELTEDAVISTLINYGRACVVDPAPEMLAAFVEFESSFDDWQMPRAVLWSGYYGAFMTYGLGRVDEAIDAFGSVLNHAQLLGQYAISERVEATLGQVYAAACRGEQALGFLDKSIQVQKRQIGRSGPPSALAYTVASKGHLLMDMGLFEQAHETLDLAKDLTRDSSASESLSILSFVGAAYLTEGRFSETQSTFSAILDKARADRSRFHIAQSETFLTLAKYFLSEDSKILEAVKLSAERWALMSQHHLSIPYGFLSEICAGNGDWDAALDFADRAITRAEAGDRFGETMAYRAQAAVAHQHDRLDDRANAIDQAYASAQKRNSPRETCLTGHFEDALTGDARVDWRSLASDLQLDPTRHFSYQPSA
jgi:class 3 adenylate cyclase/tetratricopeptide (TPR) repeat protein